MPSSAQQWIFDKGQPQPQPIAQPAGLCEIAGRHIEPSEAFLGHQATGYHILRLLPPGGESPDGKGKGKDRK